MGIKIQQSTQRITPFAGVYFTKSAFNQTRVCFSIYYVRLGYISVWMYIFLSLSAVTTSHFSLKLR